MGPTETREGDPMPIVPHWRAESKAKRQAGAARLSGRISPVDREESGLGPGPQDHRHKVGVCTWVVWGGGSGFHSGSGLTQNSGDLGTTLDPVQNLGPE